MPTISNIAKDKLNIDLLLKEIAALKYKVNLLEVQLSGVSALLTKILEG